MYKGAAARSAQTETECSAPNAHGLPYSRRITDERNQSNPFALRRTPMDCRIPEKCTDERTQRQSFCIASVRHNVYPSNGTSNLCCITSQAAVPKNALTNERHSRRMAQGQYQCLPAKRTQQPVSHYIPSRIPEECINRRTAFPKNGARAIPIMLYHKKAKVNYPPTTLKFIRRSERAFPKNGAQAIPIIL